MKKNSPKSFHLKNAKQYFLLHENNAHVKIIFQLVASNYQ